MSPDITDGRQIGYPAPTRRGRSADRDSDSVGFGAGGLASGHGPGDAGGAISTPTGDHSYGVVKRCGSPFAERIRPDFGRLNL